MVDDTDTAEGQLKRADHSLYVTLKYTRTVDVIKSAIKRLISALDYCALDILEVAKKKKIIKEIALTQRSRFDQLLEVFKGKRKNINQIKNYVTFYHLLRHIDKEDYRAIEEYRKNVTLITKDFNVKVVGLTAYYYKTKEFVTFTREWISEND